jgi:hypothetical protein
MPRGYNGDHSWALKCLLQLIGCDKEGTQTPHNGSPSRLSMCSCWTLYMNHMEPTMEDKPVSARINNEMLQLEVALPDCPCVSWTLY